MLDAVTPFPDLLALGRFLCVSVLVPELHRDLVVLPGEELLAEAVIKLMFPFLGEEGNYSSVAGKKEGAITPL